MKGPVVSIDVSKGKSDYQAFKEMNVKYTGSRSIKHTKEGFDEIVSLVRETGYAKILITSLMQSKKL